MGGLIVRVVRGALGCTWVSEYREKDGHGREGVGRFKCPRGRNGGAWRNAWKRKG